MTHQQIQTELAAIQREQYALAERIAAFVKRIDIPVDNPVVDRQPAALTPDWEIVEFKDTSDGAIVSRDAAGKFINGEFTQREMLYTDTSVADGSFTIHAVRRKDGEVFRVGDAVENKDRPGTYGTITKFRIGPAIWELNVMYAQFIDNEGDPCNKEVCNIEHYAPPQTFTTADDVIVKEGDTVWYRYTDGHAGECKARKSSEWPYLYSTREAAERGPVLFTTADAVGVRYGDIVYESAASGVHETVVSLNKTYRGKLYSTYAAALAAYEAWLYEQPVLSMKDIEGMPPQMLLDIVKEKMKNR